MTNKLKPTPVSEVRVLMELTASCLKRKNFFIGFNYCKYSKKKKSCVAVRKKGKYIGVRGYLGGGYRGGDNRSGNGGNGKNGNGNGNGNGHGGNGNGNGGNGGGNGGGGNGGGGGE